MGPHVMKHTRDEEIGISNQRIFFNMDVSLSISQVENASIAVLNLWSDGDLELTAWDLLRLIKKKNPF